MTLEKERKGKERKGKERKGKMKVRMSQVFCVSCFTSTCHFFQFHIVKQPKTPIRHMFPLKNKTIVACMITERVSNAYEFVCVGKADPDW